MLLRNRLLIAAIILLASWAIYDFVTKETKEDAISEVVQEEMAKGTFDEKTATGSQAKPLTLQKGDEAPDFQLTTVDWEVVQLSDYRGEKILLNFWATWCPPCRQEMPDMQTYHETYDDAVILAVNMTEAERRVEDVEDFLDEFGITFAVLLDESTTVANLYTAHALPTSYFIDSEGVIQEKVMGAIDLNFMKKTFSKIK